MLGIKTLSMYYIYDDNKELNVFNFNEPHTTIFYNKNRNSNPLSNFIVKEKLCPTGI